MLRLIDELIEKREARLQLLQEEGRLGLAKDHPVSLQAILGMSVERLSASDQERFALLSTFGADPLNWKCAEAAYIWECSLEDAEATTARLIQHGLVNRGEDQLRDYYWMHALLADYAEEMAEKMGL